MIFSEELKFNLTDINYFYKLYEYITIYYEEKANSNFYESTYIFKFAHLNPQIILNVIKFLSIYILLDEINKPKKTKIKKIINNGNQQNFENKINSQNKEDLNFNLNCIIDFTVSDKYLDILYEILCDIKNYVFLINHKKFMENLIYQNFHLNLKNERDVYKENYFSIIEPSNDDMVLLKSLIWDLFRNLILIKFKKDFVIFLKKILSEFKIFLRKRNFNNLNNKKNEKISYSKLGEIYIQKNFSNQFEKIKKFYKILQVLYEIIYYKELDNEELFFVDFDKLQLNLLYSIIIIQNFEKVYI